MINKREELLSAWSALFLAYSLSIKRIDEKLTKIASLTLDEYDIMLTISKSLNQRLRYSEIASACLYTKSGVTRVMKRLEKKGLIARVACAEDRRVVYAIISSKGGKLMRESWKVYSQVVLDIFQPIITQVEARQIVDILDKLIEKLRGDNLVKIRKKI